MASLRVARGVSVLFLGYLVKGTARRVVRGSEAGLCSSSEGQLRVPHQKEEKNEKSARKILEAEEKQAKKKVRVGDGSGENREEC